MKKNCFNFRAYREEQESLIAYEYHLNQNEEERTAAMKQLDEEEEAWWEEVREEDDVNDWSQVRGNQF